MSPALLFAVSLLCIAKVFSAENGCPLYYFRCSSGQCVRETAVCDGTEDCRDGSDETHATCSKLSVKCPSYAFRCAYGACIDNTKMCNGVKDCADNSDELISDCGNNSPLNNTVCKRGEFTCYSGQCISDTLLCDGNSDCYDGTDETITQCINVRCPGYSFQCAYGACIEKDKKCNGIEDCKDGSDEDDELCLPGGTRPPTKRPTTATTSFPSKPDFEGGCPLPEKPNGGDYQVVECTPEDTSNKCRKVPGTRVKPFTLIRFNCFDGFTLPGENAISFCNRDGSWNHKPECKKLCPPLISSTMDLSCYYQGNRVNCTIPPRPGTIAKMQCKPAFHPADVTSVFTENECLPDGTWVHTLFSCNPDCGVRNTAEQLISFAPTSRNEYPWHAALYRDFGRSYFCGGSIINEKAIITAAHCVFDDKAQKVISKDDVRIAVGKYRRSWSVKDTNEQRFEVSEIIVREAYLGENNRYEHDIAVISVIGIITIKPTVMPVCIDKFPNYYFNQNDLGTVVGWGTTEEDALSEELRVTKLPYYNFHECRKAVSSQFAHLITYDKFCAGLNNGTNLGGGDSGGGLVFPRTSNNKELYFLFGIVSVTDVRNRDITAFTNVTTHITWLDRVLTAIKKSKAALPLTVVHHRSISKS